jgi:hypothetical protein
MIKGKVEAKITFNIELTDSMVSAFGANPEEIKSMITDGWLVEMLNELFGQNTLFRLLGGCKVEQISAEVKDNG